MIKDKPQVPYASFEEYCAQTRTFSNTPFNMRRNNFLGTEKGFISVFKHFYLLKYVVVIFLRVRNSTSHFFTEKIEYLHIRIRRLHSF